MFKAINSNLTDLLQQKSTCKRASCRTYASSLVKIWREMTDLDRSQMPSNFKWVDTNKMAPYLSRQKPLTRRKNLATAVLAAMKTLSQPEFRVAVLKVLKDADVAYTQFLTTRPRMFTNAVKVWNEIKKAASDQARIVKLRRLLRQREHIRHHDYVTVMRWIFLSWVTYMPPRRLSYRHARITTADAYDEMPLEVRKKSNWVVMTPRGAWLYRMHVYKTHKTRGDIDITIPRQMKSILKRALPIIQGKNSQGLIFMNSRWKQYSAPNFSTFVRSTMEQTLGHPYTMNTVRSIYISQLFSGAPPSKQLLAMEDQFGTSIRTQLQHYRAE